MRQGWMAAVMAWALAAAGPAGAATVRDLLRAYPEALAGTDGASLVWRDGRRMPLGTVRTGLPPEAMLQDGSIAEQLWLPYPAFAPPAPPDGDPGRIRNRPFFDAMYGDCRAGAVAPQLVRITWLPQSWGQSIAVTPVNGIDRRLAAVSRELEALPPEERRVAYPIAGTYNCRAIAGTDQASMHGWGAAIDLNTRYSDYWRWQRGGAGLPAWRNRIPASVVAAFERHGFIWGGRWSHYDTMHFEYRPELLPYDPTAE
jgi:hypothetical protein